MESQPQAERNKAAADAQAGKTLPMTIDAADARVILGLAVLGLIVAVADDLYWRCVTATAIDVFDPTHGVHRLVIRNGSFSQYYIEATVTGNKPAPLRFLIVGEATASDLYGDATCMARSA